MSSLKTVYFTMNKWEGTDRVERTEFNENFDIIDSKLKDLDNKKLDLTGGTMLGDLKSTANFRSFGNTIISVDTANNPSDTEGIIRFTSDGVDSNGGAYLQYAPPSVGNTVNNTTNQLTISSLDSTALSKLRIVANSLVVNKNGTYHEILAKNELNKPAYENKDTISALHVYKSANTLVANSTYNQLGFDRVVYDNKTEVDLTVAGKYRVLDDGMYLFHASIEHLNLATGNEYRLALYVDGAMARLLDHDFAPVNGNYICSGSAALKLRAGQLVHVVYYISTGSGSTISVDVNYTYFTGVRLA